MEDREIEKDADNAKKKARDDTRFRVDFDPSRPGDALDAIKERVRGLLAQGRYQKVRVKWRGRQIGPDIPIAGMLAMEAATFFGAGILRGLFVNVIGRAFFEVEVIDESENFYKTGMRLFMQGDLDESRDNLITALDINPRFARAWLQLAVISTIDGNFDEALSSLDKAESCPLDVKTQKRILGQRKIVEERIANLS